MKGQVVAFRTVRTVGGILHFTLQTAADLVAEAECAIVSKTGVYDNEGTRLDWNKSGYKEHVIRRTTEETQNKILDKYRLIRAIPMKTPY